MRVLVSACLMGEECKYNGKSNLNSSLLEKLSHHDVTLICPELLGGLPVPRTPVELIDGVPFDRNGVRREREFRKGAEIALKKAKEIMLDLIILQPRSPSCGKGEIYDGTFSGKKIKGNGITSELLLENGFKVLTPDEFLLLY